MTLFAFHRLRQEFVSAYVDYIFNRSVASLFEAFAAGFHKVCGGKVLLLFQPSELQAMVIGNTNYDWKELEKVRRRFRGESAIRLAFGARAPSDWLSGRERHQIGFQRVSRAPVV